MAQEEAAPSEFKALLARLGAEHERELRRLRMENRVLRRQLSHHSGDANPRETSGGGYECCSSPSVPPGSDDKLDGRGACCFAPGLAPDAFKIEESGPADGKAGGPFGPRGGGGTPDMLLDTELEHFQPRQVWTREPLRSPKVQSFSNPELRHSPNNDSRSSAQGRRGRLSVANLCRGQRCCHRVGLIISPSSLWRVCWDLAGLLFICYDVIMIPLQAFELPAVLFTEVMNWSTLLFWSFDLLQSFFVGYYAKGNVVMDHGRIVKHYLSSWFLVDIVVVLPDWFMTVTDTSDGGADFVGMGRIVRGARAIRVLRLLRLLKLQRIMGSMLEMIESEYAFTMVKLARLLLSLFVLNHIIACLWYLLGRLGRGSGPNWLEASNTDGEDMDYKYFTSLHWSLTQFTPASMDVSAKNVSERIFSILVLFFALVTFSTIVGSITSSMTHLHSLKGDEVKQFWLLRRYLRQCGVRKELSLRIIKFLEYTSMQHQDLVRPQNIRILGELSEPLQNELCHEMMLPVVRPHPFFSRLGMQAEALMHRLCAAAFVARPLAPADLVFHPGDEANYMYFVKSGDFEYLPLEGEALDPPLQPQEWVCEAVLWTPWQHLGELRAASPAELICVDSGKFAVQLSAHPRGFNIASEYAEKYLRFLNGLDSALLSDVVRGGPGEEDFDSEPYFSC